MVLSQLPRATMPSSGWDLIVSSTSMASRFRYSMAVGFIRSSLSDMTGNSSGSPPAAETPRRTAVASSDNPRSHRFRSLAVHAIPISGRRDPEDRREPNPAARSAARWLRATSSSPPSHASVRKELRTALRSAGPHRLRRLLGVPLPPRGEERRARDRLGQEGQRDPDQEEHQRDDLHRRRRAGQRLDD